MIFFIMWSMAMLITGAAAAAWYFSKPKFTSGSGIFIPPKDCKMMNVEMRAGGSSGAKLSRAEDIPKETYGVEET